MTYDFPRKPEGDPKQDIMRLWEDLWHLIELLETKEQAAANSTETHITQA